MGLPPWPDHDSSFKELGGPPLRGPLVFMNFSPQGLTRDDDIKEPGVTEQLHGGVVDVHVAQLDVGVLLPHSDHDLLPQLADLQHVALVHRTQPLAALAGGLKRDAGNALNLGLGVHVGVEADAVTLLVDAEAARLPEVDPADELAHKQDVDALDQLALEGGGVGQLRDAGGGGEAGGRMRGE